MGDVCKDCGAIRDGIVKFYRLYKEKTPDDKFTVCEECLVFYLKPEIQESYLEDLKIRKEKRK